jgi:cardiolipin synthase
VKRLCFWLILCLALVPLHAISQTHTLIVQPDDGRAAILDALNGATQSVTLTIYEINDPQINAALFAAKRRGVDVKIIYNYYSFYHMGRWHNMQPRIDALDAAGIETRKADSTFRVTHQKTFTIDGRRSIVMTFNLQPNYFGQTRDFGIITTDTNEIAEIMNVFSADWNYQPVVPTVSALVWSPVNSRGKMLGLIRTARKTVEIYNEEAEDPGSLQAMIDAAGRGVEVRFITAELSEKGVDRNAPGRDTLNSGGVQAKAASFLYIHAKMILADFGTAEQAAYLGSENFSRTSLDYNRELGIIVREPAILDRLHEVFETDWAR